MKLRKSALAVIAVALVLAVATFWLGRAGMIERLAEQALSSVFKAPVKLQGLAFDVADMSVSFSGMTVADRDKKGYDLLQMADGELSLRFWPLLGGKVVIDDMQARGLRFNTPRGAVGMAPEARDEAPATAPAPGDSSVAAPKKKKESRLDKLRDKMPKLDLTALSEEVDSDALLARQPLQSKQRIEEQKAQLAQTRARWQESQEVATLKEEFKAWRERAKAFSERKFSGVKNLKAAMKEAKDLKEEGAELKKRADALSKNMRKDFAGLKLSSKDLKGVIDEDVAQLRKLANLSDASLNEVASVMFGEKLVGQMETWLGYVNQARQFMSSDEAQAEKAERGRGRDIAFSVNRPQWPRFLVEKAAFDGMAENGVRFSGTLTGLTSSGRRYGKPTRVDATWRAADGDWVLQGSFDRTGAQAGDHLQITGKGLALERIDLGSGASGLPTAMRPKQTELDLQIDFVEENMNALLLAEAHQVAFDFAKAGGKTARLQNSVREMFDGVTEVNLKARFIGFEEMEVSSNLDDKLRARYKQLLGAKMKKLDDDLRRAVERQADKELKAYLASLDADRQQQLSPLTEMYELSKKTEGGLEAKRQVLGNYLDEEMKAAQEAVKKKAQDAVKKNGDAAKKKAEKALKDKLKGLGL